MKTKICFFIESMAVGGAERVLLSLVNNMPDEKYDITICAIFKECVYPGFNHQFQYQLKPSVKYNYLINNSNHFLYRTFNVAFNRGCKSLIYKLLVREKYDIEIAWYEGLPTNFVSHSSNKNSKKIAWLHFGDGFKNISPTEKEEVIKTYSKFQTIVGVSKGVINNFRTRISDTFNSVTCYNIVEDNTIRSYGDEPLEISHKTSDVIFVSVGRLCPVKGYDRLIKACAKLSSEFVNFKLWIIGDGDKQTLKDLISQYQLQEKVILWGNKENPFPYVKAADWFICSSHAEGFSTAMTESLILGTPIISTTFPSSIEMLGNDEYGILVENSEKGLYEGMKRVLTDSTLKNLYSLAAGQKGKQFQKQNLIEELEKVICL